MAFMVSYFPFFIIIIFIYLMNGRVTSVTTISSPSSPLGLVLSRVLTSQGFGRRLALNCWLCRSKTTSAGNLVTQSRGQTALPCHKLLEISSWMGSLSKTLAYLMQHSGSLGIFQIIQIRHFVLGSTIDLRNHCLWITPIKQIEQ
ncbi:hypothetical protein PPACK8108_LOCUS17589, partial [Phakopsora pachyrhizi]